MHGARRWHRRWPGGGPWRVQAALRQRVRVPGVRLQHAALPPCGADADTGRALRQIRCAESSRLWSSEDCCDCPAARLRACREARCCLTATSRTLRRPGRACVRRWVRQGCLRQAKRRDTQRMPPVQGPLCRLRCHVLRVCPLQARGGAGFDEGGRGGRGVCAADPRAVRVEIPAPSALPGGRAGPTCHTSVGYSADGGRRRAAHH